MSDLLAALSGGLVGLVLGVVGGGGSILAVPLLLYVAGVPSVHVAIGTSAISVSLSALANLAAKARQGLVKWPCAISFSAAGLAGVWAGSSLALRMPPGKLLLLFGALMLLVGSLMLLRRSAEGDPEVRLSLGTASRMLPWLLASGLAVGGLAGFFGIGGGFLIVPALMFATGMPIGHAIGTSLAAVASFGAGTAISYAVAGEIDWRVAGFFVAGGLLGSLAGQLIGQRLSQRKTALTLVFAVIVIATGAYVVGRTLLTA